MKMKIKMNDRVIVLTGKDRGKVGVVSQVFADKQRVVVDGVNRSVKHMKTNQKDQKGQRIEYFGPIHVSNVMLVDEETGKPGRVGYTTAVGKDGSKTKTRVVKTSKSRPAVKKEVAKSEEKKAVKGAEKKADTEKKTA